MSSTDQLGTTAPPIRIDSSMVSNMAGALTAQTAQPATHPLMSQLNYQTINPQTIHPALQHAQRHPHVIPTPSPHRPVINQSVMQAPMQQQQPITPSNNTQQVPQSTNQSATPATNQSNNQADDDDGDDSDVEDSDDDGSDAPHSSSVNQSSKGGSSCHQCKSRRNYTALTYCTATLDAKSKKCRKKFCGHCLRKFYKENPNLIPSKSTWICPSCRKICCCAACRRRKQRESGSAGGDDGDMKKRGKLSAYSQAAVAQQEQPSSYNNPSHEQNATASNDQSTNQPSAQPQSQTTQEADQAMSDDEDHVLGHVPQLVTADVFDSVLATHINMLAEETVADHGESQFAALYKAARQGKVRKRIRQILTSNEYTKQQQVEMIARALVNIV